MHAQPAIIADGLGFVEGIRWHDGRVWFSDFGNRRVYSVSPVGELREEAWVPGQPSGLGFAPDGALLVVSVHEGHVLWHHAGSHKVIADIGAIYRGGLNDMLTTPQGRSYVSAFAPPLIGEVTPDVPLDGGSIPLFCVESDGSVRVVAENLKIPNGMALSADGVTLFVAETMAGRILAFPVAVDGSLGSAQTFVELGTRSPDGIALDRQGRLWVACPFTSEFIRFTASGEIDRIVTVPGLWAVACAVGKCDEELWCAVVETSIEDYKQGRSTGSIRLWREER
jgi:sugar lactone lactonase YvrE